MLHWCNNMCELSDFFVFHGDILFWFCGPGCLFIWTDLATWPITLLLCTCVSLSSVFERFSGENPLQFFWLTENFEVIYLHILLTGRKRRRSEFFYDIFVVFLFTVWCFLCDLRLIFDHI